MSHPDLLRDFFSTISRIVSSDDEVGISDDFKCAGGNPSAVREWFLAQCERIQSWENQNIPGTITAAVGYILSVLLFGTVHSKLGTFKAKKATNFSEAAKRLVGRAPNYLKALQEAKVPGLTHNSIVAGLPEISLCLASRMGDRPYPALLQLPINEDLRIALEESIDKQLLAEKNPNQDAAYSAKQAQRRSPFMTLYGGDRMKRLAVSLFKEKILAFEVEVNSAGKAAAASEHQLRSLLSGWARFQAMLNEEIAQLCAAEVAKRARSTASSSRKPDKTEDHSLLQRAKPAVILTPRHNHPRDDFEADDVYLMQTDMKPWQPPGSGPHLARHPQDIPQALNAAFAAMPTATARARARGLLYQVMNHPDELVVDKDNLQAVLVTYALEPGESPEDPPPGAGLRCLWVSWWWRRCSGVFSPDPEDEVETVDADSDAREEAAQLEKFLAEKEDEEKAEEAAVRWHLEQRASEQQQAEDDAVMTEAGGYSYRPPKLRPSVSFRSTMGPYSREFSLDLKPGTPWTLTVAANVDTQSGQWTSPPSGSTDAPQPTDTQSGRYHPQDPWVVGMLALWQKGTYTDEQVRRAGGTALLRYCQQTTDAQQTVFSMNDPWTYGVSEMWKAGRLTDEQVLRRGGRHLLAFLKECAMGLPEDTGAEAHAETEAQPTLLFSTGEMHGPVGLSEAETQLLPGMAHEDGREEPVCRRSRAHSNGRRRLSGGTPVSSDKDD
ncbi:unnamed protein product [Symbiodinium sp. CCMP2592]|nr:unnamed protein product [Symbiodinium sp. CCMP2592]